MITVEIFEFMTLNRFSPRQTGRYEKLQLFPSKKIAPTIKMESQILPILESGFLRVVIKEHFNSIFDYFASDLTFYINKNVINPMSYRA